LREFILLFRQPSFDYKDASPKEMQALSKQWNKWWKNIESQGKLANRGPRLANEGKVLKAGGVITDGPFVEIREILGSFIIVRAENLDDATTLAHGCPALDQGGSVEVRPVFG
jgi:hypothetical protein